MNEGDGRGRGGLCGDGQGIAGGEVGGSWRRWKEDRSADGVQDLASARFGRGAGRGHLGFNRRAPALSSSCLALPLRLASRPAASRPAPHKKRHLEPRSPSSCAVISYLRPHKLLFLIAPSRFQYARFSLYCPHPLLYFLRLIRHLLSLRPPSGTLMYVIPIYLSHSPAHTCHPAPQLYANDLQAQHALLYHPCIIQSV